MLKYFLLVSKKKSLSKINTQYLLQTAKVVKGGKALPFGGKFPHRIPIGLNPVYSLCVNK